MIKHPSGIWIRKSLIAVALLCASAVTERAFAEVAIIVNADNNAALDLEAVIRIYLAQVAIFPGGGAAQPVALPDGSRIRGELNLALLKAAPAQVKSQWAQRQMTGGLTPLPTYDNDNAIIKAVAETPNAIGYVDAASVHGNVRVALKL
jgi:ABC-type phosphate transport system substrate-binding protein